MGAKLVKGRSGEEGRLVLEDGGRGVSKFGERADHRFPYAPEEVGGDSSSGVGGLEGIVVGEERVMRVGIRVEPIMKGLG